MLTLAMLSRVQSTQTLIEKMRNIIILMKTTFVTLTHRIAVALLVVTSVWRVKQLATSLTVLLWSTRQKHQHHIMAQRCCLEEDVPWLIVLVPALREQSVLARALKALAQYEYPRSRFAVIVVTTEKEIVEKRERRTDLKPLVDAFNKGCSTKTFARLAEGIFSRSQLEEVKTLLQRVSPTQRVQTLETWYNQLPTTPDLAQQLVSRFNAMQGMETFYCLHYPYEEGMKASQLNYAVSQLSVTLQWQYGEDKTYIAVCDADAIPDPRTGRALVQLAHEVHTQGKSLPAMLQQVPVPLLELDSVRGSEMESALLRSQALLHLRRSLGIEIYKLLYRQWLFRQRLPPLVRAIARPMVYGIGAGLYIKLSTLKQIGLFPEPVDDLGVGYRISMLDLDAVPLPYFCYVEPYSSLRQLIQAYSFVFFGGLLVGEECQRVSRLPSPLNKNEQAVMIAKEWLDSLSWMFGIPLVTCAMIVTIIGFKLPGMGLVIGSIILQYSLPSYLFLKFLPWMDVPSTDDGIRNLQDRTILRYTLTIITTPLQPFIFWLSPVYYLFNSLIHCLKGRQISFGKTER